MVRKWAPALALIALGLATGVSADEVVKDAAYYQAQITDWEKRVAALEKADAERVASEPLAKIRTIIGQAQAFLANEQLEKLSNLEAQVQVLRKLAALRVDRTQLEKQATETEALANQAEAEAKAAKEAADAMAKRYEELEKEGL